MNIKQVAELFQARYDKVVVKNEDSESKEITNDTHTIFTLFINLNIIVLGIIGWVVQKIINNYY